MPTVHQPEPLDDAAVLEVARLLLIGARRLIAQQEAEAQAAAEAELEGDES